MRSYETTFIVNPQADDVAIDRQVQAVVDLIEKNGGTIIHANRMGTRKMAYEIAGLTQGYYSSIVFESGTEVLPLLERLYKLEEPYIRYLTIKYEGDIERLKTMGSGSDSEAANMFKSRSSESRSSDDDKDNSDSDDDSNDD